MTHEGKAGWPSVVYTSTRRSTTRQSETFFFFRVSECLSFSSSRALAATVGARFVSGLRESRAESRFASFPPEPFAWLRRRGGPRATERRGTWRRTARRARVVSYRCALRGRDASRPVGWMPRRARGHRASSGGSVRSRGLTRDDADAGEAQTRALNSEREARNTRTELSTSPLAAVMRLKHSPMTPRASRVVAARARWFVNFNVLVSSPCSS